MPLLYQKSWVQNDLNIFLYLYQLIRNGQSINSRSVYAKCVLVCKAVKNVVDYGLANRDLGDLLYIGIDEISRKKGHVYHTQVYDLIEKRLLWSGEDRTAETLEAFFDYLGKDRCEHIEAARGFGVTSCIVNICLCLTRKTGSFCILVRIELKI